MSLLGCRFLCCICLRRSEICSRSQLFPSVCSLLLLSTFCWMLLRFKMRFHFVLLWNLGPLSFCIGRQIFRKCQHLETIFWTFQRFLHQKYLHLVGCHFELVLSWRSDSVSPCMAKMSFESLELKMIGKADLELMIGFGVLYVSLGMYFLLLVLQLGLSFVHFGGWVCVRQCQVSFWNPLEDFWQENGEQPEFSSFFC